MIPFFTTARMHEQLKAEMADLWQRFYTGNWYILGDLVEQFETEYANFCGVSHCIGVANGLDALQIALRSLSVGPGDEVIVPSNTYIATWLAVSNVGATPVPVEPDPRTWNISPEGIKAAITGSTKAIIPVHLYGQSCEMNKLIPIAKHLGIKIVEDNAQSHGATCDGQPTGSFGDINASSFYPTKNLGALGDAGALTTNDAALADFVRCFRNYGSSKKYYNEVQGINSRLDALQAAILSLKLPRLRQWNAERASIASLYATLLCEIPELTLPYLAPACTHVWHLYVIKSPKRDALQQFLSNRGIQTMIHYPVPPHLQQAYKTSNFSQGAFPVAEELAKQCLSLPLFPGMLPGDVERVCAAIQAFHR